MGIQQEKTLLRCPLCDAPLAKRSGDKLFIVKDRNRERFEVGVEVRLGNDGHYRIKCPCGGGHIFAHINEGIKIEEEFSVKKESVS